MKRRVVIIILILLIISILGFIIFLPSYLNKYQNIKLTINERIYIKEEEIKLNNDKLVSIKNENSIKYKNIENMNNYIDSLNKRIKEYER